MKIKQIFDEIANESSTNQKMVILGKYVDNTLLKDVLYYANTKRVKYWIKQIPEYTPAVEGYFGDNSLQVALFALNNLSERKVTGHDAVRFLTGVLSTLDADDAYIIERIIEKDCKIGMGTSNINKVFKKLIEDTPYMGAKAFEEKLAKEIFKNSGGDPAYSQLKMDGRYANAIIRSGEVELESRQGEPTLLEGAKFIEELKQFDDCVLNGELTMDGVKRYESNGIIASLVSIGKKISDGEDVTKEKAKFEKKHVMKYEDALNAIRFTVWDVIEVDEYFDAASNTPYYTRLVKLGTLVHKVKPTMISEVDSVECETYEDAMKHFQKVLKKGEEGTILKAFNGKWKDGKPNWQVKMKLEMDVDLKIVGFNYGTGKNVNVISSVNAESACGKVFTRPTGIDEEMMQFITDNQDKLLGKIVEVKCCGLSQDSEGKYALLHPVFKQLRDDKSTADTLEAIVGIEAMAKGLVVK